ncbi:MAG: hypothetical protein IPM61_03990 [Chlorobi bacterium]|nr:hypothetical protein [Chlorobiota bacterium]MBX7216959.1 hypothetical protein [Candidatus Kapabacteria bacterium]
MPISITPVRTARQLNRFIGMVWDIYKGDPNWVPPVKFDRKRLLNRQKNPFWQHSQLEMFLAELDGQVVGRVAAIINGNHNATYGDKVGFFGFFESINDQEVANRLLDAAQQWLAERGMEVMRGPVNPSLNDEAGLLVEGFDDPPQILMTYNPKYYSTVIETFGLAKSKDMFAYRLTRSFLTEKIQRVQAAVRQREGLTIRNVDFGDKSAFQRDVGIIKDIYNMAWQANWGFVKMTDAEFDFIAKDLKQLAEPDFVLIAEANGQPVGFALGLPDINQVLIQNKSGGLLGAILAMLRFRKRINRGRIFILGVIPRFQRLGIDAVLYYEVGTRMVDGKGYREGEASWVVEDNVMMNRAAQMMNGELYKRYRLYDKIIKKN